MDSKIQEEKGFIVTLRDLISQSEVYDVLYAQDLQEAIQLATEKYLSETHKIISIDPVMDIMKKNNEFT